SFLDGRGGLEIGKDVFVDHATIMTAMHDMDDPQLKMVYRPVVIEPFAVVFKNATILPGCTIGRGAIVAIGALVSRDAEPMAEVAGNPARAFCKRKVVHEFADLRWMNGYVGHRWRELIPQFVTLSAWWRHQ